MSVLRLCRSIIRLRRNPSRLLTCEFIVLKTCGIPVSYSSKGYTSLVDSRIRNRFWSSVLRSIPDSYGRCELVRFLCIRCPCRMVNEFATQTSFACVVGTDIWFRHLRIRHSLRLGSYIGAASRLCRGTRWQGKPKLGRIDSVFV